MVDKCMPEEVALGSREHMMRQGFSRTQFVMIECTNALCRQLAQIAKLLQESNERGCQ